MSDVLYVAVSDSDKPYAGYDGGEQTGGRGRWRVGFVGPWTAKGPPPIARRDPKTGLIRSGYLEEVVTSRQKDDGTVVAVQTKQVFETAVQMARRLKQAQQAVTEVEEAALAEVTDAAKARAKDGGLSVSDTLKGGKRKGGKPSSPDKVLQGRASDNPVG